MKTYKAKIVFVLCLTLLLPLFSVLSVGAEPRATTPTDLTGYTVTVPSGWGCISGYGSFEITHTIPDYVGEATEFYIGYRWSDGLEQRENRCVSMQSLVNYTPSNSITLVVTGGSDSSNSTLISWLVDNNATFSNGSTPEPDPDPELFPIAGGFYAYDIKPSQMPSVDSSLEGSTLVYPVPSGSKLFLTEAYNVNRGTEIPIQGLVIQFANIVDSNNYHIKVGVWYTDDIGFTPENVFTIVCTQGVFTKVNRFSFSRVYFSDSVSFDEWGYQFFNAVFVPSDQPVPNFDGSPIAYIISSINDALRVDIFGTFSIMDVVTVFVSISLLIWILKMLAGG